MDIKEKNYIIFQFAGEYLRKHAHGLTDSILEEYFDNPQKTTWTKLSALSFLLLWTGISRKLIILLIGIKVAVLLLREL